MIGLQEYIINNNIKVTNLAEKMGIQPSAIWRWFNVNKVPEKHHTFLSEKFNIDKDYINKVVNDISTYQPKVKGFNNKYIIDGDNIIIYLPKKDGRIFETHINTNKLNILIKLDRPFTASYYPEIDNYYATCTYYFNDETGKRKHKTLLLHKLVMGIEGNDFKVDHINQTETLDNRDSNLRIVEADKNSSNRKGANKNNNTGHRNVSYIEKANQYWVQHMKKGIRYKKIFSANQYEEACKYSDEMREKLFGNYKGNS